MMLFCTCIVDWLLMVCLVAAYKGWGKRWATVEQEARDEVHDAEILRAVQESMAAWTQRRSSHRYVYVFFREVFCDAEFAKSSTSRTYLTEDWD